jgi:hypothetical protein
LSLGHKLIVQRHCRTHAALPRRHQHEHHLMSIQVPESAFGAATPP